jgi:meiotically up-regulated gene 157 (Mug157) protein
LQPTDDLRVYPYLTYDNVLVWFAFLRLAEIYPAYSYLAGEAQKLKESIVSRCVKELDGEKMFAWSIDADGNWDVYDEPPGSLLLLPHYGFCTEDDPVWLHTKRIIRREEYPYSFAGYPIAEIGCPHAPHPWVLSIANSLLSGDAARARQNLLKCEMDNGVACESVDEYTGQSATGDAFATCAGFLAYAMDTAFSGKRKEKEGIA